MAIVKTDTKHYTNIANTIREKTGSEDTYTPDEMDNGIVDVFEAGKRVGVAEYNELFGQLTDWTYFASYDARNVIVPLLATLDTSNGRLFSCMFQENTLVEEIPLFDTGNGEDFESMFNSCSSLKTIPLLNTTNGTNFKYMFSNCSSLEAVPQLITNNGIDFGYMFSECSSLQTIPALNFSNGTTFTRMFSWCASLTSLPQLDCSKGINVMNMFDQCTMLESISELNISSATKSTSGMFGNCSALKDITIDGAINVSISFQYSPNLTVKSMKSIIEHLKNYAGTANASKNSVKFHDTALSRLEAEGATSPNGNTWTEYIGDLGWTY